MILGCHSTVMVHLQAGQARSSLSSILGHFSPMYAVCGSHLDPRHEVHEVQGLHHHRHPSPSCFMCSLSAALHWRPPGTPSMPSPCPVPALSTCILPILPFSLSPPSENGSWRVWFSCFYPFGDVDVLCLVCDLGWWKLGGFLQISS